MKSLPKNSNIKNHMQSEDKKPKLPKKKAVKKKPDKNISGVKKEANQRVPSEVGAVYLSKTMFIDSEPKLIRRYIVLRQREHNVTIAKLKSIKKFDENSKNTAPFLVQINENYPGLTKRTGVDKSTFRRNRVKHKVLDICDKDVFLNKEFTVSNRDLHKAQVHTGVTKINRYR